MPRYIGAMVFAGRLYLGEMLEGSVVQAICTPDDRVVHTVEDLRAAVASVTRVGAPARRLFIAAELEEAAREVAAAGRG